MQERVQDDGVVRACPGLAASQCHERQVERGATAGRRAMSSSAGARSCPHSTLPSVPWPSSTRMCVSHSITMT